MILQSQHNSADTKQAKSYPDVDSLAYAWPRLNISAGFKQQPEDFVVEEVLPFELQAEGEHVWLFIEKVGTNTDWLAGQLARFARIKAAAVGYSGLKDRHAVARQWFSVHLPGTEGPDWQQLQLQGVTLLEVKRHRRKLRRGAVKNNHFQIRLRDIDHGIDALIQRCALIQQQGVPNYFGKQRFGHDQANLRSAERVFSGHKTGLTRHKRSLALSAARSFLFNQMVSTRVQARTWNSHMAGDVFMLDGSQACFRDDDSAGLGARLDQGEIHPTAALQGEGDSMAAGDCLALEQQVVAAWPLFEQGLIAARVEQQRRACRVIPQAMHWQAGEHDFRLEFSLRAGSYATVVLRELVNLCEPGALGPAK